MRWFKQWYWLKQRGYIFIAVRKETGVQPGYLVSMKYAEVANMPRHEPEAVLFVKNKRKAQRIANLLNSASAMVMVNWN